MRYTDTDGTLTTVYLPNERHGGLVWAVRQAVEDIWGSRHVIVQLFMRDFVAQFRQKLLGYFWAMISPLLGIISFLFLYVTGVLQPGQSSMPYTLYILLGTSVWSCLPGSMSAVSGGLQAQADLIMRTRIPKLSLAVSSLANLCYGVLISMITMLVVFLLHGVTPSWCFLLYPLLVLPMLLLGTAMGLVLSVLGVIARDLPAIVTQGLSLVMFITPIIYLTESIQSPLIRRFIVWNPLTYLVDVPRSLLVKGYSSELDLFLGVSCGVLFLVVIGLRVFYLLEDLVAERL